MHDVLFAQFDNEQLLILTFDPSFSVPACLAQSAERLVWIVDLSKQIGDVLVRFCFGSPTSAAVCTYLYLPLLNALTCGVQMGGWVDRECVARPCSWCRSSCWLSAVAKWLTERMSLWGGKKVTDSSCLKAPAPGQVTVRILGRYKHLHIQGNDEEAHVWAKAKRFTEKRMTSWWHLDLCPTVC